MKAIGTLSIIKLLEGGQEGQRIEKELRKTEKKKEKVYLSNYTLLELAYLLEFNYSLEREKVGKILKTFLKDPLFKLEEEDVWEEAIDLYLKGKSLLDALREVQYKKNNVEDEIS